MAFNPLFYQLLLITLVLICLLVHIALPNDLSLVPKTPLQPKPRRHRRAKEPKPFAGLIQQPLCEACEHGTDTQPQALGSPPPVITFTRGRKRTVDTQAHFCPDPNCSYYGWLGLGNLRANGHPGGQPWRQFQCVSCRGYFYETTGTIFHGKHASPDLIVWTIACLCEGLGIRGTARVFGIDANTVLQWLVEAAEQLQTFSDYFLHELHINQVQLDELYAVLRAVRNGELSEAEAVEQLSRSPHWVWTAIDPETKLLLCVRVGEHTLAMSQAVFHQIAGLLAPSCVPLFLSDGYAHYLTAIVTHFGCWVQPLRKQAAGPAPKPRWIPLPGLLYAQVIKTLKRRRIVEVKHRVVFGTKAAVDQVLSACGWQINTAMVERLNLSLRQRVAAVRRRSASACQSETGLTQPLILFQAYHNFVLPHASLHQPLGELIATNGAGSAKRWRARTLAMAAGLTDHVWSLREVLLFRVLPWPQPQVREWVGETYDRTAKQDRYV